MHEMSLAVQVAEIAEREAQRAGLQCIERLSLTVGELAGVELPALELALASALAGTVAASARIDYVHEAGQGECQQCQAQFAVSGLYEPCPLCGGFEIRILQGRSLKVKSLEGY